MEQPVWVVAAPLIKVSSWQLPQLLVPTVTIPEWSGSPGCNERQVPVWQVVQSPPVVKSFPSARLINPPFASLLADRLSSGGRLRLATDWQDYAEQMLAVLNAESGLENEAGDGFAPRFEGRNITRFEARGQRLGHPVWDLCYRRAPAADGPITDTPE